MRALFFGSPAFAVPCLDAVARVAEVVCVVTQPDRPRGRGLHETPPAVKVRALELGLRVEQPTKIRTPEFAELVRSCEADVAVVVAYGRILPKAVLDGPRRGCLNVHASLLPRHRGAAPIQWAVASFDAVTGVTLMQMDEGLDTGPMLATASTSIGADETADELAVRLSTLGADLLDRHLADAVNGRLAAMPQPSEGVTHARLLEKSDGLLPLGRAARLVHAHARGMTSWPGPQLRFGDAVLKVHGTSVVDDDGVHGAPGAFVRIDDARGAVIACGNGTIGVRELQQPGRNRLPAAEFVRGHRIETGTRFEGAE